MTTIFICPSCRNKIRILNDFSNLNSFARSYICSCGFDPATKINELEIVEYKGIKVIKRKIMPIMQEQTKSTESNININKNKYYESGNKHFTFNRDSKPFEKDSRAEEKINK